MKTSNKELASIQLNQAIEQLKEINEPTLMQAHNDYCQTLGYEDEVFYNDEYEINSNFTTAFDALRNLQHYNLSDDYFYFHNGNLISFSYLTSEQSPITFSELAQWIINEDKLSEYDISVTTLDDIYNCILDNLEDSSSLDNIIDVINLLELAKKDFDYVNESPAEYENSLINEIMLYIEDDYTLLSKVAEFMKLDV